MKKLIVSFLFIIPLSLWGQGSEMISNGNFDTSSDWTICCGSWTVSGGTGNYLDTGNEPIDQLNADMVSSVIGSTEYVLKVYVSDCDRIPYTDQAYFTVKSTNGAEYVPGSYYREDKMHTIIFTTPADVGDGGLRFHGYDWGGTYSIDSISLKTTTAIGSSPYYVDPDGDDTHSGAIGSPWRTLQRAFQVADAGDSVYFRDGVYYSDGISTLSPGRAAADGGPVGNSGTSENPIVYMSYPDEWAIFDASNNCEWEPANNGNTIYNKGMAIEYVEHVVFKNFEVRNVFQCDNALDGGISSAWSINLTFDHVILHNVGQRGFYVRSGAWKSIVLDGTIYEAADGGYWDTTEDTTRFINCDAYDLCDSLGTEFGNGADAWHTVTYKGNYFYWEGCRAWHYSDDGWNSDGLNGGLRVIRNSWAMATNKYRDPLGLWETERNGFKVGLGYGTLGSGYYDTVPNRTIEVTNCIAMFCGSGFIGITTNTGIYANNTAYSNNINFNHGQPSFESFVLAKFRNNVSWDARTAWGGSVSPYNALMEVDTSDYPDNIYPQSHNTWDYTNRSYERQWVEPFTDTVTVTAADFLYGVDSTTLDTMFRASRNADGSLPTNPFTLASTSDLIDAGIIIPLTDSVDYVAVYNGAAPDMGAVEYGAQSPAVVPTVVTGQIYNISTTTANVLGNNTDDGGGTVSQKGICWSTSATPTTANDKTEEGSGAGTYSSSMTNLTPNETYYVRAYAINEEGTAYGSEETFKTKLSGVFIGSDGKPMFGSDEKIIKK